MTDQERIQELERAISDALPRLRLAATGDGYGFYRPENPHDFSPDPECCTPQEIANHKAACEAYDRGEKIPDQEYTPDAIMIIDGVPVSSCGGPWGIGSYTVKDPELTEIADRLQSVIETKP